MPPKPPLLSPAPAWWVQPSTGRPKTPPVNFSAILAAAAVSFAVVVGVLAWIVTHPGKTARQAEPVTLAVFTPPSGAITLPAAPPPPPPIVAIPVVHRPERDDVLVNHIPQDEEAPPPLPPPVSESKCLKPPPVESPLPPPAGETYGTQVLFLNNPAAAEETAKREKKLLFVMHISGNFEDSCFT